MMKKPKLKKIVRLIGKPHEDETISYICKHFVIRWRWQDETKEQLIGAGRYHLLVGQSYCERHFAKAKSTKQEILEFRVNKRFVITFKSK